MQKYIIDREMMLLALQWMPKELRDEWASECIEVPGWATHFAGPECVTVDRDGLRHFEFECMKEIPEG